MTLWEKAKEIGVRIVWVGIERIADGCPWTHGLETKEESMAFCVGHHCWECYAREYKPADKAAEEKPAAPTIEDSGNRTPLGDTGFVRDIQEGKGRMDLLPWHAIMEVSVHCAEGAKKYGERNIDKGAPLHSLLSSGARHLAKYILGQDDEDPLRDACWNLLWALEQRTTHPECNDMPWAKEKPDA